MDARLRTTVLINLASILEKCDEQILPALYARVGATFNASPTQLGNITLARAFMQAISSPFAGIASHFLPRSHIIATGCLLWATFTALFACTSSINWALPICAINGIGLALVIPSVQSLVADMNASDARGRAFGSLWLTISFGGMLGALFATNIGAYTPFGMEGWRFAFFTVALLSAVTGVLNGIYVHDPTFHHDHRDHRHRHDSPHYENTRRITDDEDRHLLAHSHTNTPLSPLPLPPQQLPLGQIPSTSSLSDDAHTTTPIDTSHADVAVKKKPSPPSSRPPSPSPPSLAMNKALVKSIINDIYSVLKIKTFSIIILQGIIGSIPYASLVFLTLYLQLLGMTDAAASALVALYLVGGGFGGLLGGWVGDAVSKKYPNHGRVFATQFSVLSGIPCAFIIFKALPLNGTPTTFLLYAFAITCFAMLTAWPAPCANNPIFAEIVPIKQRNLVYSFDRCFEGAIAAFATPFVGMVSQRYYGFSGASTVTGDPTVDLPNAIALGNALITFLVIPWLLCFLTYSGLHWTYPVDRRNALLVNAKPMKDGGGYSSVYIPSLSVVDGSVLDEGGGMHAAININSMNTGSNKESKNMNGSRRVGSSSSSR